MTQARTIRLADLLDMIFPEDGDTDVDVIAVTSTEHDGVTIIIPPTGKKVQPINIEASNS